MNCKNYVVTDTNKRYMGITFDIEQQKFIFDFEHDGTSDLVTLTGSGYQVEAFGKCFYYGYEFEPEIDSETRTKFIQYVKFSPSIQKDESLSHFIQKAINDLNAKIDLYDYDLVIYPESSSQVNQYMLRYIYRFAQPTLRQMQLVKALPANIAFDTDAYTRQYLDDVLENGRPRYTQAQKDEALANISKMMDLIHSKDYFTIAKDVKKSKMRPYMLQFLQFATDADRELCATIKNQNILVIDDITTSGSTLNEILRTLRILNEDNSITIFSLLGRKNLMAEMG